MNTSPAQTAAPNCPPLAAPAVQAAVQAAPAVQAATQPAPRNTRRNAPNHALIALLRAHGVDVSGAYELRPGRATEVTSLQPGMLYAAGGKVYHLPHRASPGYIGRLIPGTPEADAYLALARPVELPTIRPPSSGWATIWRLRAALEKST